MRPTDLIRIALVLTVAALLALTGALLGQLPPPDAAIGPPPFVSASSATPISRLPPPASPPFAPIGTPAASWNWLRYDPAHCAAEVTLMLLSACDQSALETRWMGQ